MLHVQRRERPCISTNKINHCVLSPLGQKSTADSQVGSHCQALFKGGRMQCQVTQQGQGKRGRERERERILPTHQFESELFGFEWWSTQATTVQTHTQTHKSLCYYQTAAWTMQHCATMSRLKCSISTHYDKSLFVYNFFQQQCVCTHTKKNTESSLEHV